VISPAAGGVVCGRIAHPSLYLPWLTGVPSRLSTTIPPKGLASLPGRTGRLPSQSPHRSVRARLTHTVPQGMASLREPVDDSRTRQRITPQEGGGNRSHGISLSRERPVQPLPPDTPHLLGETVETAAVECDPIEAVVPQHFRHRLSHCSFTGPVAIHPHHWYTLRTASSASSGGLRCTTRFAL